MYVSKAMYALKIISLVFDMDIPHAGIPGKQIFMYRNSDHRFNYSGNILENIK